LRKDLDTLGEWAVDMGWKYR